MSAGLESNMIIYDDQLYAGMTEVLVQNAEVFNGASRNAIRLVPTLSIGDYRKESFFTAVSSLVSRRDLTSVSTAADTALGMDDRTMVKINRKIGPVANTMDSLKKIGYGTQEFSFRLGQQIAKAVQIDYLNTAIRALVGAIGSESTAVSDTADTLKTPQIFTGLAKFGDAANRVVALVMHSFSYFQLIGAQITENIYNVGGVVIATGSPVTGGLPVIVTDCPALVTTADTDGVATEYGVLALTENAGAVLQSEGTTMIAQAVTGLENLVYRMQGEHAFTLDIKGYSWEPSSAIANPTDAQVVATSSWDNVMSDVKDTAGILIKHDAT